MTDFDRIYRRIGVAMGLALIFALLAPALFGIFAVWLGVGFFVACLCAVGFVACLEIGHYGRIARYGTAAQIRKRADAQHAAMMSGNWQRGIYGEHPPPEELQTPPSWVLADQTLQRRIDEGYDEARRQVGRRMRLKAQAPLKPDDRPGCVTCGGRCAAGQINMDGRPEHWTCQDKSQARYRQ